MSAPTPAKLLAALLRFAEQTYARAPGEAFAAEAGDAGLYAAAALVEHGNRTISERWATILANALGARSPTAVSAFRDRVRLPDLVLERLGAALPWPEAAEIPALTAEPLDDAVARSAALARIEAAAERARSDMRPGGLGRMATRVALAFEVYGVRSRQRGEHTPGAVFGDRHLSALVGVVGETTERVADAIEAELRAWSATNAEIEGIVRQAERTLYSVDTAADAVDAIRLEAIEQIGREAATYAAMTER